MLSPIQRVPTGLFLPGGTILPLPYQVGSATRSTTLYEPAGLGLAGAPTAVGNTRSTRSPWSSASLRSGILTTMRRAGGELLSCAIASATAISIVAVIAAILVMRLCRISIFRFLLTGLADAKRRPDKTY